jgi:hypothetical protein
MDPEVYLQLGNLVRDKDRGDHSYLAYSDLYQPCDAYEQTYSWEDDFSGEEESEVATAYRRILRTAVARLDLLGYSLNQVRAMYEHERRRPSAFMNPRYQPPPRPPFDVIAESIRLIDVSAVRPDHPRRGKGSPWAEAATGMLSLLKGDPTAGEHDRLRGWYEINITGLDPFTLLQMLARNPVNLDLPITWHAFNEIMYEYASPQDIEVGAKRRDRFLIVTEGSSDTAVIKKALSLFRPHVADFFDFIDMDKNYPLTGIGNLHNLYQGLLKIGILNNVLFIYDNDTEGTAKLAAASQLAAPGNVRIMKLPDMASFENFSTVGPTGEQPANINGKAVSIECFLDLQWRTDRPSRVRWTGYHTGSGHYQGELEDKQAHVRRFLALSPAEPTTYDTTKLNVLLDTILATCSGIAAARLNEDWLTSF